jgi:hypothetical protein
VARRSINSPVRFLLIGEDSGPAFAKRCVP